MIHSATLKKRFGFFIILAFIVIAPFVFGVGGVEAQNCSDSKSCESDSDCSSGQRCQKETICKDDSCGGCAAGTIDRNKCVSNSTPAPKPNISPVSCLSGVTSASVGTISWSSTNPAVTWVDISPFSNFSSFGNKRIDGGATSTSINGFYHISSLAPNTTYYVRTWNGSAHSATTSFRIPTCPTPTSVPAGPSGLSKTCNTSTGTATFSWGNTGASRYILRINQNPGNDWFNGAGGDQWVCVNGTSTTRSITQGVGYYDWTVQSSGGTNCKDANGNTIAYGIANAPGFTCAAPTNTPTSTPVPPTSTPRPPTNTPVPPTATNTPRPPTATATTRPTNTPTPTIVPVTLSLDTSSAGYISTPARNLILQNVRVNFKFTLPSIPGECGRTNTNTSSFVLEARASGSGVWEESYGFYKQGNTMFASNIFRTTGPKWIRARCKYSENRPILRSAEFAVGILAPTNTPTATPTLEPNPPAATNTPTPTITPTKTPTNTPTATPTLEPNPQVPTDTPVPTNTPEYCTRRPEGDADCNDVITSADRACWKEQFKNNNAAIGTCVSSDFNGDEEVTILDYSIWIITILKERSAP